MEKTQNSAFYRGFLAGMASPFTFMDPPARHHIKRHRGEDILARSWRRVGRALESAMNAERTAGDMRRGDTARK